jgi:hypothetical protein
MYMSKLAIKALMRPSWPLKLRIWACLVIQSYGYETDVAVVMRRGEYPGAAAKVDPITPGGIISMLKRAAAEAFQESELQMTDQIKADLKISKQHMRRALAAMEQDDGLIVRAKLNCQLPDIRGRSFDEALKGRLVTPIADLPTKEAQKLGTRQVGVFLLAKPRPARNLEVAQNGYLNDANSPVSNKPYQLTFNFMRQDEKDLKKLCDEAAAILPAPYVEKMMKTLQEGITTLCATAKAELQRVIEEAKSQPHPQTAPLFQKALFRPPATPEDFNETLAIRFLAVGAGVPTRKQSDAMHARLGPHVAQFLDWMSPLLLQERKPRHAGILPSFVEEFEKLRAASEQQRIARQLQEQQRAASAAAFEASGAPCSILEARAMLADPQETEQHKQLARQLLVEFGEEVA